MSQTVFERFGLKAPEKVYNYALERVEYILDDTYHRDPKEGPAIEYDDGSCIYIQNGMLHNPYGPAIIWKRDAGLVLTVRGYSFEAERYIKDGTKSTKVVVTAFHSGKNKGCYWYQCGKKHRDPREGPAIDLESGYKMYYICGMLHNDFGPAIVDPDHGSTYMEYSSTHNLNGPAVVNNNGTEEYAICAVFDSNNFTRPKRDGDVLM
jgi:hypothetical protein